MEGSGMLRSDVGGGGGILTRAAPAEATVTETPWLAGLSAPVSALLGERQPWVSLPGSELCWRDRGTLQSFQRSPLLPHNWEQKGYITCLGTQQGADREAWKPGLLTPGQSPSGPFNVHVH